VRVNTNSAMRNAPTNPSMADSARTTAAFPAGGGPMRNVMNDWKLNSS